MTFQMTTVLLVYVFFLIVVSVINYRDGFKNIFSTEAKIPWVLAGFSLFVINPELINIISKMGIVAREGYSGLWIFYTGLLGAGLLPIFFAPLWSRLKFMTDNQFILLRFSGKPARILHLFRAGYVGYLVVALLVAQVFIGMSKLFVIFFDISYLQSFLVIGTIVILLIAKNSLQLKVRTDFLNGIIYILAFIVGAIYVVNSFGGFSELYSRLAADYPEHIRLFPESFGKSGFGSAPTLVVYFLVQWWSIHVLDGAGPEAQRFMNTGTPLEAFKAAFLPLLLFSLVFLLHSFVLDAGIIMIHESPHELPAVNNFTDTEAGFIHLYKNSMPASLSALVLLAFLIGFISFTEAFINWGAGFVVVDIFRTYLAKKKTERFYSILSYFVMLVIGITGMIIAWYNTHLLGFQKFIFSMAAGVGPVFILRWFWWRINAWSQFTAMVTSLIFAFLWDGIYNNSDIFSFWIDSQMELWNLSYYAFKLVCLTFLVTVSWLVVTYLTKPDDKATLENFIRTVRPGGFWPGSKMKRNFFNKGKFLLLVLYSIVLVLPFIIIWTAKFRDFYYSLVLVTIWIGLLYLIVKRMARISK